MSFLIEMATDLVADVLLPKQAQRKRRMRKLRACAVDAARADLPPLSYDDGSVGSIRPGAVAWAKLPKIDPVLVLARDRETAFVARLVDAATPGAIRLSHAAHWELLKDRDAVDISHLLSLPAQELYSEGKRVRRSDFELLLPALGQS